jgi:hypothetical protein
MCMCVYVLGGYIRSRGYNKWFLPVLVRKSPVAEEEAIWVVTPQCRVALMKLYVCMYVCIGEG